MGRTDAFLQREKWPLKRRVVSAGFPWCAVPLIAHIQPATSFLSNQWDKRRAVWAKFTLMAGRCLLMAETIAINSWLAGGIISSGELALYFYLDLALPISLSAAKPRCKRFSWMGREDDLERESRERKQGCGDGWSGEREHVCEERAAKIVDGEREEKASYLVESGQTEIRPLLIFASPRRFVSSLNQCLNRVKGIEAHGRAWATLLELRLLYNGSVISLD
ncbi:hypothetical protein TIFTF001_027898 [Ficus carica]|uniref:Uncharacterized protein n=1 Tax=Ficus carica TaxID=3494 RepID=A0AA88DNW4_FICCA|nr:hypothetical protein TIFTF001_027898 [Ficus carica]